MGNHLKKTDDFGDHCSVRQCFLVIFVHYQNQCSSRVLAWEVQYQEEFLRHLVPLSRNPDDQHILECWEYWEYFASDPLWSIVLRHETRRIIGL